MTRDEAFDYARRWADAWNRRDVETVLEHFDDEVTFSSPKAVEAVGRPTVQGKAALRDYWQKALRPVTSLKFTVRRILWDPEGTELAIIYDREINDRRDRASEVLHFGPSGHVTRGEVFYGVVP
jgi:ketosteroid isomerase-like protein